MNDFDSQKITDITGDKWRVIIKDELDSTNNEAKRMLSDTDCENTLIIAKKQTAGRGRQGKSFFSPEDCGLYMSVILKPDLPDITHITTMSALAVCVAIEKVCGVRCDIKWVNDIYLNGKKVCGILTENMHGTIILGIGINITTAALGFPAELAGAVALDVDVDKNKLAGALVRELCTILESGEYIEEYRKRNIVLGRDIEVVSATTKKEAHALKIDERGGLVVQYKDGATETLFYGEISIKGDFK